MSTSYIIYRFTKPTKHELSGKDYFSEYDAFYLHDSDGEQMAGYNSSNQLVGIVGVDCSATEIKQQQSYLIKEFLVIKLVGNGKGYPCGLKGEEIPVEARIMALAEVFLQCRSELEAYYDQT